jgi:carbon monoxide dehydrogenase subunit G
MALVENQLTHTFHTDSDLLAAVQHFSNFDQIQEATVQAERFERVDDRTLKFWLKPQRQGTHVFRGEYTLAYTVTETGVSWRTVGAGNITNIATVRFRQDGARTAIDWEQTIQLDLPVNRFVLKMLRPLVNKLAESSLRGYVERMLQQLDG